MSESSSPGSVWRADWPQRLADQLRARGHASVGSFVSTEPTKSLVLLAAELGDFAAVQLEWAYLDEARQRGDMERCARDLLVRQLHEKLPLGWSASPLNESVMRRVRAVSGWSSSISSRCAEYLPLVRSLGRTMMEASPFPDAWLPADPDDPVLVEFFRRHWVEP